VHIRTSAYQIILIRNASSQALKFIKVLSSTLITHVLSGRFRYRACGIAASASTRDAKRASDGSGAVRECVRSCLLLVMRSRVYAAAQRSQQQHVMSTKQTTQKEVFYWQGSERAPAMLIFRELSGCTLREDTRRRINEFTFEIDLESAESGTASSHCHQARASAGCSRLQSFFLASSSRLIKLSQKNNNDKKHTHASCWQFSETWLKFDLCPNLQKNW
jgi:hypothetical protein